MSKNIIFSLLLLIPALCFSQKQYKTPVHSMGLEANWSSCGLAHWNIFSLPSSGQPKYAPTYGGSVVFPYQYAPKSSFIGLQSGLGFFMWGASNRRGWNSNSESLYFVGIPLAAQIKVSRAFWLEAGVQTNFAVYNELRHIKNWNNSAVNQPGQLPIAELQAIFGFRYHIFRSFSFKARIHHGLTPAYRINFPPEPPQYPDEKNYRYRFMAFEMGMSYLFPLKK